MSTVEDDSEGPARLMFTVGSHLVEDMSWVFRLKSTNDAIVERAEYQLAVERLIQAATASRMARQRGSSSASCVRGTPPRSTRWRIGSPFHPRSGSVIALTYRIA